MANKRLTFTSWFLLVLAAAFFGLIGVLINWGGRIEATLLVHGNPVFVVVDAGRPRIAAYIESGRRPATIQLGPRGPIYNSDF